MLPTELWRNIIEDYDIKTYRRCMLVNKLFYGLIQQIINEMPNYVTIKLEYSQDEIYCELDGSHLNHTCSMISCVNSEDKWIHHTYLSNELSTSTIAPSKNHFLITKQDILCCRNINLDCYYKIAISLPTKLILSKKPETIIIKRQGVYVCIKDQ